MNMQKTRLLLSGGGDEIVARPIDEFYVSLLPTNAKVLYIPVAWKTGNFEECLKWYKMTYGALGLNNAEMRTDLEGKQLQNLTSFDTIYIGGGNTFLLLHYLKETGFLKLLRQYIQSGKLVFGGSAGAIILGKDIRTAGFCGDPDENTIGLTEFEGLNLINDYTIQCHYEPSQDIELEAFVKENNRPTIALSKETGLYVENGNLKAEGTKSAYIFTENKKVALNPDSDK